MKKIKGENIVQVIYAHRKGRNRVNDQTRFELGVGYCLDDCGDPTGKIRIRTEQIESTVAPVVATLDLDVAKVFRAALDESIRIAESQS